MGILIIEIIYIVIGKIQMPFFGIYLIIRKAGIYIPAAPLKKRG